jgi:hypothetical protein
MANNKQVYLSEDFTVYLNQRVSELRFIDGNESPDLTKPMFSVKVKPVHLKLFESFLANTGIQKIEASEKDLMYFWQIINNLKKKKIIFLK